MTNMKNPLGDLIGKRRQQLGVTQAQLAQNLGVTRSLVTRWESGARTVAAAHLRDLAAQLDVPYAHLCTLVASVIRRHRLRIRADYRPLVPLTCSIEEMTAMGSAARALAAQVRERLGPAAYDNLAHRFLRQTRWELLAAHALLVCGGGLECVAPLEAGCQALIVADDKRTYIGHQRQFVVRLDGDGERFRFFPQVPIAVVGQGKYYRVDYLVTHSKRYEPTKSVIVELDGSVHDTQLGLDAERTSGLTLPVIRLDNETVLRPHFATALIDRIRREAAHQRVRDPEYQRFLRRKNQRMDRTA